MRNPFWRNRIHFETALYRDSMKNCRNPGRGWYRIFSMDAALKCPTEEWIWEKCGDEQLALLIIDIGRFANAPLGQEALKNIETAFGFFRQQEKELIIRFVYDRKGRGMESEPSAITYILRHIEDLSCILKKYKDIIFCIQGLFIGSWGEMHSSRYLTPKALGIIWERLRSSAPESCFFAVRKPEHYRTLTGVPYSSLIREEAVGLRLGLFNDGLLGSETDLGTFLEDEISEALDFQDRLCRYVPNGGEAVGSSPCGDIDNAVRHFKKLHISYLNSLYDEAVLLRWKSVSFGGINGYDYIGMHLGYRFLVTDARLISWNGKGLAITIKNTGFANIYDECEAKLYLQGSDCSRLELGETYDLRQIDPDTSRELAFPLPRSAFKGRTVCYEAYLKLCRKKDGRKIILANENANELFLVGRIFS